MKKAIVIGGGIAGCAAAFFLHKKNFHVDLIESSNILGAGNRTSWFGGHPHTFGPRHIITKNQKVYNFLDEIFPLREILNYQLLNFQHEENCFFNFPPNVLDIENYKQSTKIKHEIDALKKKEIDYSSLNNFEEYWSLSLGNTLYEKFVGPYSSKMWPNITNNKIDDYGWSPKGAPLRSESYDVYPKKDGWLVAYPDSHNGYDYYFDFFTKDADVYLSTTIKRYDPDSYSFYFNDKWNKYDVVVSSISPDTLFNYSYGELPFVGRDLEFLVLPAEHILPENIYMLYYPGPENFTRIVEYKKFTNFKSNSTLIGIERPSNNGKHYPLPLKKYQKIANKYISLMPENFYSVGRAGCYDYTVDIDDSVEQAMNLYSIL